MSCAYIYIFVYTCDVITLFLFHGFTLPCMGFWIGGDDVGWQLATVHLQMGAPVFWFYRETVIQVRRSFLVWYECIDNADVVGI